MYSQGYNHILQIIVILFILTKSQILNFINNNYLSSINIKCYELLFIIKLLKHIFHSSYKQHAKYYR